MDRRAGADIYKSCQAVYASVILEFWNWVRRGGWNCRSARPERNFPISQFQNFKIKPTAS